MPYHLLADAVVLLHAAFVLFAVFGGLLLWRWPRLAWLHTPALLWSIWAAASGLVCPLTPLENRLRLAGGGGAYDTDFIEHYLVPILYPEGLTRPAQTWLAIALLSFNFSVYLLAVHIRRRVRRAQQAGAVMPAPTPARLFVIAVVLQSGVALLALALGWLIGEPPLDHLRWQWQDLLWGGVSALPVALAVMLTVRLGVAWSRRLLTTVENSLQPLLAGSWAKLALVSLLAGVGEEALFRGVLQSAIAGHLGTWVGLVAASLLFGAAHYVTRTYALIGVLFGLYLGGLYLHCDNLLAPMAAHGVYDLVLLIYMRRRSKV